jgi:outer membrane protein OmpA-like peptidoglycan-associated protein
METELDKPRVGIEIVGKKYIAFLDLDKPSTGTLDFTTVADNQSKAIVKVFLFKGSRKTLVRELEVRNLPPGGAGNPDIALIGEFDGRKTLSLKVVLDGKTYKSESLDFKKHLPKKARAPALAVAVFTLAIGFSLFLYRAHLGGTKTALKAALGRASQAESVSRQLNGSPAENASRPAGGRAVEPVEPQKTPSRDSGSAAAGKPPVSGDSGGVKETAMPAAARPNAFGAVYFEPGSALLDKTARAALDSLIPQLGRAQGKITITGRCALYGTEEGRVRLSELRARRVADYLRAKGWVPAEKPVVKGVGGREPVTRDAERQHLNRMVEIVTQ